MRRNRQEEVQKWKKALEEKKAILIVDDDSAMLTMLREGLSWHGYLCKAASDGERALDLLRAHGFALLITDVIMPGMNGLELTAQAKLVRPDVHIIVMTAFSEDDLHSKAVAAGASDFIKKPFTLSDLMGRIKRLI